MLQWPSIWRPEEILSVVGVEFRVRPVFVILRFLWILTEQCRLVKWEFDPVAIKCSDIPVWKLRISPLLYLSRFRFFLKKLIRFIYKVKMYSCLLFCFLSFLVCAQTHPGNLPPPPPSTHFSLSFFLWRYVKLHGPGFEDVRSDWADKRSKDTVVNSFGKSLLNMCFLLDCVILTATHKKDLGVIRTSEFTRLKTYRAAVLLN